jgi:hypothetical protein
VVRANSGPRRGVALLAVVLLHAGLLVIVTFALRTRGGASRPADLVSTLIFLEVPPPSGPAPGAADATRPSLTPLPSTAITLPPLTPPLAQGPVDWQAAAQAAAAAAAGANAARASGHNPASDALPAAPSPAYAVHEPGEQYRDWDGTAIVWVSDRCFIASAPPLLGTPDVIARAGATHTVCKGDPGWDDPGHLFKDLPAYERYHPQGIRKPLTPAAPGAPFRKSP